MEPIRNRTSSPLDKLDNDSLDSSNGHSNEIEEIVKVYKPKESSHYSLK